MPVATALCRPRLAISIAIAAAGFRDALPPLETSHFLRFQCRRCEFMITSRPDDDDGYFRPSLLRISLATAQPVPATPLGRLNVAAARRSGCWARRFIMPPSALANAFYRPMAAGGADDDAHRSQHSPTSRVEAHSAGRSSQAAYRRVYLVPPERCYRRAFRRLLSRRADMMPVGAPFRLMLRLIAYASRHAGFPAPRLRAHDSLAAMSPRMPRNASPILRRRLSPFCS